MADENYPLPIGGLDGTDAELLPGANDDSPAEIQKMPPLERLATGFIHALRTGGLVVPISSSLLFTQALLAVGVGNGDDVYWAGRATLVTRPEDLSLIHI